MSMGDFYAIAKEFGTPCQPGDDLSEAVARVLTEVMRRLMDDDAPEREWTTGPLLASDLDGAPAFPSGDLVRHVPSGKVARVRRVKAGYLVTDEGPDSFGQTWALADCVAAPPEPALRLGDWVRDGCGAEGQIDEIDDDNAPSIFYVPIIGDWFTAGQVTRIEPPVGWPVAVPDPDAPGGVHWYVKRSEGAAMYRSYTAQGETECNWLGLLAAGGVPALAPEPTP